ncbi:hypothetical protein KAW18_11060 [candidate division WOR-3 bacterium]|nr:hypothetical protein [candidate division WOR-3 bacterium]
MSQTRRAQNTSYKILDERIKEAYKSIIKAEKRIPTQAEVAKRCDIAERTVIRHLEQINLTELVQPYRVLGNEVLSGLFKEAVGGNVSAMKLYFMLIYDWSEKQEVEHKGEIKTVIEVRYEEDKGGV